MTFSPNKTKLPSVHLFLVKFLTQSLFKMKSMAVWMPLCHFLFQSTVLTNPCETSLPHSLKHVVSFGVAWNKGSQEWLALQLNSWDCVLPWRLHYIIHVKCWSSVPPYYSAVQRQCTFITTLALSLIKPSDSFWGYLPFWIDYIITSTPLS